MELIKLIGLYKSHPNVEDIQKMNNAMHPSTNKSTNYGAQTENF